MNKSVNLKNLLKQLLYYQLSSDKKVLCNLISEEIDSIGASIVFEFLTWHKIALLLPPFTSINNYEIKEKYRNKNKDLIELANEIENICVRENISICFLKGISLLMTLYDDLGDRAFSDIDIFVKKSDTNRIHEILIDAGFVQGDVINNEIVLASKSKVKYQKLYTHELYQYVIKRNNKFYFIDINQSFSWTGIHKLNTAKDFKDFEQHTYKHTKYGYKLSVLDDTYQFVHLCVHFYNEAMYFALSSSYKGEIPKEIKLFRLFDICLLIIKKRINPQVIYGIAKRLNAIHKICYVLSLIEYLFEDVLNLSEFWSYFSRININSENHYFDKKGNKIEWPLTIEERIFNIKKRNELITLTY